MTPREKYQHLIAAGAGEVEATNASGWHPMMDKWGPALAWGIAVLAVAGVVLAADAGMLS